MQDTVGEVRPNSLAMSYRGPVHMDEPDMMDIAGEVRTNS